MGNRATKNSSRYEIKSNQSNLSIALTRFRLPFFADLLQISYHHFRKAHTLHVMKHCTYTSTGMNVLET